MTFPTKPGFKVREDNFEGRLPGVRHDPAPIEGENFIEILRSLRDDFRNWSDINAGRVVQPDQAGHGDPLAGQIDISSALTISHLPITPTYMLNFYDIPEGLGTFDVRINNRESAPIDVLRSGHKFKWPTPIRQIFITTAPAIATGLIRFILGGAEIVRDARSGTIPHAVHFDHLSRTLVGAGQPVFTFPLVPTGLKHIYELLTITSDAAGDSFAVNVSTGAGIIAAAHYRVATADQRRGMVNMTVGSGNSELHASPLTIWGGERLIVRGLTNMTAGEVVALDYRYRVETGVQIHGADPQTVVITE